MLSIKIDESKCSRCGQCVAVCTKKVIQQADKQSLPEVANPAACADCGHCVSVCPADAITVAGQAQELFESVADTNLTPDQVCTFLRSKRSIRCYADRPVERELLERVVEVARQAPSDKNRQDRSIIVVTDRQKIREMDKAVCESFAKLLKVLSKPVRMLVGISKPAMMRQLERNLPSLEALVQRSQAGEFPVFHDAPCVVIITGPKGNLVAKETAAAAQHYLMLQGHAEGLGSCIIGYASARPKPLLPFVEVPNGHEILAVNTLGYPQVKYRKLIRRGCQVIWD